MMMMLYRVLYLLTLLLSIASVCVATEEVTSADRLHDRGETGPAGPTGSCSPDVQCPPAPNRAEDPHTDCAEAAKKTCTTEGNEHQENCLPDALARCTTTKEPAPTSPKEEIPKGKSGPTGTVGAAGGPGAEGTGALPAVGNGASTISIPVASQATKPDQREADHAAAATAEAAGGQTSVEDPAESSDKGEAVGSATTADGASQQPSSSNTTVTESTSGPDTSTENGSTSAGTESTSTQSTDVGNTETSTTTTTTTTTTTLPPETVNNKKGDADSSSSISSSVWVRVPLLIVVTLACILVC
ncbi:uncharacterized protein TM35_000031650 [Trypanosoma theileri]|uniref:Mucin TcMUCII n=1 Tax=Trypanosoma theileri TaxID=67003 RepID=A0A1X0P655_9TRYP|nr:uncharacterized protein TM35_000031650 [Trypanosoma theileri]ORC92412.1 hypothetical protein TM35_000031650 [Trypanosoma theileri]